MLGGCGHGCGWASLDTRLQGHRLAFPPSGRWWSALSNCCFCAAKALKWLINPRPALAPYWHQWQLPKLFQEFSVFLSLAQSVAPNPYLDWIYTNCQSSKQNWVVLLQAVRRGPYQLQSKSTPCYQLEGGTRMSTCSWLSPETSFPKSVLSQSTVLPSPCQALQISHQHPPNAIKVCWQPSLYQQGQSSCGHCQEMTIS